MAHASGSSEEAPAAEIPAAEETGRGETPREERPGLSRALVAALLALAVGLVAGIVIGRAGTISASPEDTSVDAGFARDMQTHHDQAVEMSLIVRDRTDDERVRTLAYDIARTQSHQSGQMAGWLQAWGLRPTASQPVMTWMEGHAGHGSAEGEGGGPMPGMASAPELADLAKASGSDAEVRYLQLMIRHHAGGVPMAEVAQARAAQPEVRRLAGSIISSQRAEIDTMTELLAERGAKPLPERPAS